MRLFTYHLKAHTISNKLVSKVFAQKKGGKVMTATNMCSDFGSFRYSPPRKVVAFAHAGINLPAIFLPVAQ